MTDTPFVVLATRVALVEAALTALPMLQGRCEVRLWVERPRVRHSLWAELEHALRTAEDELQAVLPEGVPWQVGFLPSVPEVELDEGSVAVLATAQMRGFWLSLAHHLLGSDVPVLWPGTGGAPRDAGLAWSGRRRDLLPLVPWAGLFRPIEGTLTLLSLVRGPEKVGTLRHLMPGVIPKDAEPLVVPDEDVSLPELCEREGLGVLVVSMAGQGLAHVALLRWLLMQSKRWSAHLLLVPGGSTPLVGGSLDASDGLLLHRKAALTIEHRDLLERATPFHGELTFHSRGELLQDGLAHYGTTEVSVRSGREVVVQDAEHQMVPAKARILPRSVPLGLFPASQPPASLDPALNWVAVRMRRATSLRDLRKALPEGVYLFDAARILDEGHIEDAPHRADTVRMDRVARRIRGAGWDVRFVHGGQDGHGYATPSDPDGHRAPSSEVEERTAAAPSWAASLDLQWDNQATRRQLLQHIHEAEHRVNLQTYMLEEGHIGEALVQALGRAAERGVTVRVLVDSLASGAGSFGLENPVVQALDAIDGVQVVRHRPVRTLGLVELKNRNHRKLLTIDGRLAWVSGRNIGDPYYTSLPEVQLQPDTHYREVPWLDLGITVTGDIVEHIEASFLRDWTSAGGPPFEVLAPPTRGELPVWLVLHEGLEDAHTLEAFRLLIDRAREHIAIANTFPIQQELVHALLKAMERGVELEILVGNVRPLHGTDAVAPFPGAGTGRDLANAVIHGRLEVLAAAGAKVREAGLLAPPPLGRVLPHVHAKALVADRHWVATGSANFDLTAAYWESEALVVVGSTRLAKETLTVLRRWGEHGRDMEVGEGARKWLSRHWPGLVG